jgi:hypothetical protein
MMPTHPANPKQAYAVLMKRLATAAIFIAAMCAIPASAQRGGGHGGFSGHSSGGGFRSGAGIHSAPGGSVRGGSVRSSGIAGARARAPIQNYRRAAASNALARSGSADRRGHRRPYYSPYHTRYPYLLAAPYGWIGPGYLGYPDDSDSSDASAASVDNGGAYDAQPPEPDQEAVYPPYPPQAQMPGPQPASGSEEAVTLVFKDGRPTEQIRNYILTPTTLYVQDRQQRAIPVEQLDLLATAKINQDAGVTFQLPNTAQ